MSRSRDVPEASDREPGLLRKLALLALGIVLSLALAEGILQLGALVVSLTGRQPPKAWETSGRARVLCIGDSNTFGLWLPPSDSYPAQLERLWNERFESPKLEVLNLGIPGTNSSRVVRDYDRILRAFEPDLVLLQVGVNDAWTRPFEEDDDPQPEADWLGWSRVAKLIGMAVRTPDSAELEMDGTRNPLGVLAGHDVVVRYGDETFEWGYEEDPPQDSREILERGLRKLVEKTQSAGVPMAILNYASRWGLYPFANPIIDRVAEETKTLWVDVTGAFEPLCSTSDCPDFLLRDQHPTARGQRVVAESTIDVLLDSGLLQ